MQPHYFSASEVCDVCISSYTLECEVGLSGMLIPGSQIHRQYVHPFDI